MVNIADEIADNIQDIRKAYGFTFEELAKETGISAPSLKAPIAQKQIPTVKHVLMLSKFSGHSFDYLIFGPNTNYPKSIEFFKLCEKIDKKGSLASSKAQIIISTALPLNYKANSGLLFDEEKIELAEKFRFNLRILRDEKEYTQTKLAQIIGQERSIISLYERGVNNPTVLNVARLSQALNFSCHALLTGEKLYYQFNNADIKETAFLADTLISVKEKIFLNKSLRNIIAEQER